MFHHASPQKDRDGDYIVSWINVTEATFERYSTSGEALIALTNYSNRYPDNVYMLSKVVRKASDIAARKASLSRRERQVLELVLSGQASKNIAVDLGLSRRTVEHHRRRINTKMGTRSIADLVRTCHAVVP